MLTERFIVAGVLSIFIAASTAAPANAQQEPFGQEMDGWKFTQAPHPTKAICRAFSPGSGGVNIIGRLGNGKFYVSVPANGIPKGKYPDSTLTVAGSAEPVDAESDGSRFALQVDDGLLALIIKARGYQWQVSDRGRMVSGSATFNGSIGKAVARLRECTKANGGR